MHPVMAMVNWMLIRLVIRSPTERVTDFQTSFHLDSPTGSGMPMVRYWVILKDFPTDSPTGIQMDSSILMVSPIDFELERVYLPLVLRASP